MFADWMFMMLENADTNKFGLGLSIFIHLQITMIVFAFQYMTYFIKNAVRKLENLRDSGRSEYSQVELNAILGIQGPSVELRTSPNPSDP